MELNTKDTAVEHYLEKYKMHVTEDEGRRNRVVYNLLHNTMRYGVPYCPCQSQHTADTVCPCKYMKDAGTCRCGLYVK